MMGPTHALFGATAYAALPIVGVNAPLKHVLIAAGVALLPDLDHPSSTATKFFGPIAKAVQTISGGHRKITHRWWFLILVTLATAAFIPHLILPIGVGYGSHLIGDLIPTTGGWFEKLIHLALWPTLFCVLIYGHLLDRQVI